MSEPTLEELEADEGLRRANKKMWKNQALETLYNDMEMKNIKLPAPIIPLGCGWYLVRPKTREDVKIIRAYGGNKFAPGWTTIGYLPALEYEKAKGRKVGLLGVWRHNMRGALQGYDESWVKDLRQHVDGLRTIDDLFGLGFDGAGFRWHDEVSYVPDSDAKSVVKDD